MHALLSVSDKTGIVELARGLDALGVKLLSTGGTATLLKDAGLPVTEVAAHTGFPEMLDGRVKTLHPAIHGGLLARRDSAEHMAALDEHRIATIDLLVVNLYPFEATVAKAGCTLADAIENIDIGGPAMVRSAAKNWADVAVLTDRVAVRRRARRAEGRRRGVANDALRPRCRGLQPHRRIRRGDQRLPVVAGRPHRRRARAGRVPGPGQPALRQAAGPALRREPAPARGLLSRAAAGAGLRSSPRSSCRARSCRTTTSPMPMRPGNA